MAEVDSLEIKLEADAKKAAQTIETLISKVNTLAVSLGSLDTSAMSSSAKTLSGNLSSIKGNAFSDISKSAKNAQKAVGQISETVKKGIKSKITFDISDYKNKVGELESKFSNAGKSFKPEGSFSEMEKQAGRLSSKLETLLQKEEKIVSVGKVPPDGSAFLNLQYDIAETINKLDALYSKINETKNKGKRLSEIKINRWDEQTVKQPTAQKPKTVNIPAGSVGYNKEAVKEIEKIANGTKEVKKETREAESATASFGERIKSTTSSATPSISSLKNRVSSLANGMKKLGKESLSAIPGVKGIGNAIKNSRQGVGNLAKRFISLYAAMRAGKALFGGIKSSMDYIENLNYFNSAFGQVAEKADLSSFRKMGYDSAESYYNSFSQRAEQLTQKMSGFKIEKSGMSLATGKKSMGIDPSLVMNYQAMFAQMSSSMGVTSEISMNLSETFTKLGADLASVRNMDFAKVWQDMASSMVGMSRTVDKYGANIRNANLQQQLTNLGISTSISKLNQQEKALLRTIIMLDSTRYAWGDMSKTMDKPANQLRLLQSSWSNLSRTIGNIFLPLVAKILPYLNALTIVLQRFAEGIVKLLGFKDFDWGGLGATGGSALDLGSMPEDSEDVADNMDKTAKKAKKLSDNLQGFDLINKLQKDESDNGENKIKGLSPSELGKLTGKLTDLMDEYNKKWNEAFAKMQNKANGIADKIQKALIDGWKKGDFSELGAKVAAWINKNLEKIPWGKIKRTVKKIAKSIATFLNGFIKELNWSLIGKTLAEGLNTVIDGAYEFWTTFDWLTLGESLAEGIDSFINNFNAEKFGKLLGAKLRGMIKTAYGMVTTFIKNNTFNKLGEKIGNAINGFLEDMGKVDKKTGLTGWQELGKSISGSITGILDTITTALSTVKWSEVGKAIADFLGSIEWGEILTKTAKAIGTALFSALKAVFFSFTSDPIGVSNALVTVLGSIFVYKKLKGLKGIFSTLFGTGIKEGISGVTGLESTFSEKIGKLTGSSKVQSACSKLGKVMSFYIGLNVATSIAGAIGSAIKSAGKENGENIGEYAAYAIGDSLEFSASYVQDLLAGNFKGIEKKTKELGKAWKGTKSGGDAGATTKKYENDPVINRVIKKMEEFGYSKNSTKVASVVKNLSEGLKSGKISTGDVLHATYKKYDTSTTDKKTQSVSDFLDKIGVSGKVKSVLKGNEYVPLITQTTKYKSSVSSLEKKMKKLGATETEVKETKSRLKNALEKGEISWEKYKKIVDGNYKSTNELNKAIKKLSPKTVKVKASTEGKKDVDELKESVDNLLTGNQNLFYKVTTQGINDINTLKTAMGSLSNKVISATISPKLRKDWYKLVQKELLAKTFTINAKTTTKGKGEGDKLSGFAESIKNAGVKSEEGKKINYKKLASLLNKVDTTWDKFGQIVIPGESDFTGKNAKAKAKSMQMSKDWKSLIEYLRKMGIRTNNPILFASGGFPEDGWFRASHGEIMGQFDNGKSVVANNKQITDGIAQAVGPAVYAAVKAAMNENGGGEGQIVINLDGKKIAESTVSQVNAMTRQKGRSPILVMN